MWEIEFEDQFQEIIKIRLRLIVAPIIAQNFLFEMARGDGRASKNLILNF